MKVSHLLYCTDDELKLNGGGRHPMSVSLRVSLSITNSRMTRSPGNVSVRLVTGHVC